MIWITGGGTNWEISDCMNQSGIIVFCVAIHISFLQKIKNSHPWHQNYITKSVYPRQALKQTKCLLCF